MLSSPLPSNAHSLLSVLFFQPEMGYRSSDKPRPRGQICIGGPNVTLGYYGDEKQTHDAYFTDSDGIRYFKTGDIGEWTEDGTLRIFDRKKDLVKLSHGEVSSNTHSIVRAIDGGCGENKNRVASGPLSACCFECPRCQR